MKEKILKIKHSQVISDPFHGQDKSNISIYEACKKGYDQAYEEIIKGMNKLSIDDVEWVVNDLAELGVKIGDQFFFLYKGRSYQGGSKWRYVGKREFGECCHPWSAIERKIYGNVFYNPEKPVTLPEDYVGFHDGAEEEWKDLSFKGD